MSARTTIEHALRVYFADSRDPQHIVDTLLARYDVERAAPGEKCIPDGNQPSEDGATHQHPHPRPCEFPEVLPCRCVRPGRLPEASFLRARHRACIAAYFRCARYGRADAAEQRGVAA